MDKVSVDKMALENLVAACDEIMKHKWHFIDYVNPNKRYTVKIKDESVLEKLKASLDIIKSTKDV